MLVRTGISWTTEVALKDDLSWVAKVLDEAGGGTATRGGGWLVPGIGVTRACRGMAEVAFLLLSRPEGA